MDDGTLAKRIADLREKASRCRLAAGAADSATAATLRAYALELEGDAARLASTIRGPEPVLPAQALPQEEGNSPHSSEAVAALKSEVSTDPPVDETAGNVSAG